MKLALSQKTCVTLAGILVLAVISSTMALVSAWRAESAYRQMLGRNLEQARTTYELEIALLEQGFSTSLYLMGGDPNWLSELRQSRPEFQAWLEKAGALGLQVDEQQFTERITNVFAEYDAKSRQVVALYAVDRREQAKRIWLEQALEYYDRVYTLCEGLSSANTREMEQAILARGAQVRRANLWVMTSLSVLAILIVGLGLSLSRGVFRPLRHLVESLGKEQTPECSGSSTEEIRSLGSYIGHLRGELGALRSQLSLSQRHLLDAEKLASVGKLAATVAHEIRSPLTSMRLRVFSMQRALADSHRQKDFELISEEITRLDNIVGNFLEFARPRELALQPYNVRLLLDRTLELLAYKLEATNIVVERRDDEVLPNVLADRFQLKQVLLNLLNNAIEALGSGGTIRLTTRHEGGRIRVFVQDSGPGIPPEVQEHIFDPFVGTKEESTGLGLWIARRIMTEHGGGVELEDSTPSGTTFSLWLPVLRENEKD